MGQGHSGHKGYCCDLALVVSASKELESILEKEFNAHGKGLHEYVTSVEKYLTPSLVKKMRFLATIRNKLVHERGFDKIPDKAAFIQTFETAEHELQEILKLRKQQHGHSIPRKSFCIIM